MKYRVWTQNEIDFLLQNYESMKIEHVTESLNDMYPDKKPRLVQGVKAKAGFYGLKQPLPDYVFYQYGKEVAFGTIKECADQLGKSINTTMQYTVTSRQKLGRADNSYLYGVRVDD